MNALARHNAARQRPPAWERRVPRFLPQQTASVSAADALEGAHPLADAIVNAGLLAVQILAVADGRLQKALVDFKEKLAEESRAKNKTLAR